MAVAGCQRRGSLMAASTPLDLGRAAYDDRRWRDAVDNLTHADRESGLPPEDLERLATATILIGQATEGIDILVRAHQKYLAAADLLAAAQCAGWIGMQWMNTGEQARSSGWFARAERLVSEYAEPCAVEGFLLVPMALGALYGGDAEQALAAFSQAAEIGGRFHDPDLTALARMGIGQAQIMLGDDNEGLGLLDEVMVAVTAGEISPILSGLIYCAVIDGCHLAFDVRRAFEWTSALDRWCQAQQDLVPFSGHCQMHRAELFCLHGAWSEARAAAKTAQERVRRGDRSALFGGYYQQAEVQRLSGEFEAAEQSYREAHRSGFDPQPGLALLRLAQGKTEVAQSLIRQAVDQADPAIRRRRLPALVEIDLAAGDLTDARLVADELVGLGRASGMPMVQALAHQAEGSVLLAEGDAPGALARLRRAWSLWMDLDAPYEAARCRVLAGRAYQTLHDADSAAMEFSAARSAFVELGAAPAVAELDALTAARTAAPGGLTPREIQVVRLVATGRTNKAIAAELYLSDKTVARHLSNIFVKLGSSSRVAATAFAYEHGLV
jgi:DNA-binding CsgD family transcriptional regulator